MTYPRPMSGRAASAEEERFCFDGGKLLRRVRGGGVQPVDSPDARDAAGRLLHTAASLRRMLTG